MIISSGYNIAGPEVEVTLLSHPTIFECAVISFPDKDRGSIVQAHIVLNDQFIENDLMIKELQDYVKNTIAPYKYPRSILLRNPYQRQKLENTRFLLRENSN